jgi:ribonuclease HII
MPSRKKSQSSLTIDIPARSMLEFEERLWAKGCRYVCGVDEVGRGPLAGPVLAAAVILPVGLQIDGVTDSKQLTAARRRELYDVIKDNAVAIGVGAASHAAIDRLGIMTAIHSSFRRALMHLRMAPDYLLVDGFPIPYDGAQTALFKGDSRSQTIAAASIIAKVTRDRLMEVLDPRYPQYGFAQHKGYGTASHLEALRKHGPCAIHRRSFKQVLSD